MSKWKCPNTVNVQDHPVSILFVDEEEDAIGSSVSSRIEVPKPAYCSYCARSYLKSECIEVRT